MKSDITNNIFIYEEEEDDKENMMYASLPEKIEQSKKALMLASDMSKTYYKKPLIIAYSGGKDSDVMLHLAESCLDVSDFEVLNSHTTVDAPETVYHIRDTFKRLNEKGVKTFIDYHKQPDGSNITMWNLIPTKGMPPTRIQRYCCSVLKEASTPNRLVCLGVRAEESSKRKNRDIFQVRGSTLSNAKFYSLSHADEVHREAQKINDPTWDCTLIERMRKKGNCVVNPIYYWLDIDVWDYIRQENIKTNPLYERGYKRVGCIGCPMATYRQVLKQFAEYPTYEKAYKFAFQKMVEKREADGKEQGKFWKDGQSVFDWWIEKYKHEVKGQIGLFDDEE